MENIKNYVIKYAVLLANIIISCGLLFGAIFLLRSQLFPELEDLFKHVWLSESGYGVKYDGALIISAAFFCLMLYVLVRFPLKVSALLLGWFIYVANLSNALYYRYFGERLDWWIVKRHITDVPSILDSAGDLMGNYYFLFSILIMVLFTIQIILCHSKVPKEPLFGRKNRVTRYLVKSLPAFALALILGAIALNNWNFWQGGQRTELYGSQIVKIWIDQIAGRQLLAHEQNEEFLASIAAVNAPEMADPAGKIVQIYGRMDDILDGMSEWDDAASDWPVEPRLVSLSDPEWPLLKKLQPDEAFAQKMRANLGLPLDKKPHVIFLFVESFRAYDFMHPEIGPAIFPQLHKILEKNGLLFRQAYSSSWASGQTARGNFSTQCSNLPNNRGKATYIAKPNLPIRCIEQVLKNDGYYTLWTSATNFDFHNMGIFEKEHGIDNIVDEGYYRDQGIEKIPVGWGLLDDGFLDKAVDLLVDRYRQAQKPLYVNMATLSTHHPHSIMPGFEVPAPIMEKYVKTNEDYEKHLSRWYYEDAALGHFFKKLFASEIGDDTLVVMMADHAGPVNKESHLGVMNFQERRGRIMMSLVTKNMQKPGIIPWPVHQIDVAPTVAHIVGAGDRVSWLGRGLFSRPGSAWIYSFNGGRVQYRIGNRACFHINNYKKCHDYGQEDALFNKYPEQTPTAEDEEWLQNTVDYYEANMTAIKRNKIYPRK